MCLPILNIYMILSASVIEDCYNFDHEALSHSCVVRLLRSIDMNTMFAPTPQGGFDARTVYFLPYHMTI